MPEGTTDWKGTKEKMEYISIIIQGIIQGLTEFLPVSSSGHLSVAQHFMNVGENSLITSVILHLGTLLAVFIAFFPTIWGMIKEFFLTIKDIFTGILMEEYERKQTYDVYGHNLYGYACAGVLLQRLFYRF